MADISSSSESELEVLSNLSSSSDDDLIEIEDRDRPKNKDYLDYTVPQFNDEEFIEHFRVSRRVVNQLCVQFQNSDFFKPQSGSNGKISALHQLTIFLWFAGHQTSSFRDVADRFDITISCLHRIIKRLTYFLSNLSPQIIKWPSEEEKMVIDQHFREKRFQGVIGAIDGTHIKIDKPENDPDSYINRKKYYSIQMQVVCDHQKRIRDCFIGYPGSVHDSRVYRTSPLANTIAEKCGGNYFIIGDSGYPCQRHLITPFRDRGNLSRAQREFNTRLSGCRYVVEHCFGHLKQKFRQLFHVKLRKIDNIVHFIRACCVLHNLSLDDHFHIDEVVDDIQEHVEIPADANDNIEGDDMNGIVFRNLVMNNIL